MKLKKIITLIVCICSLCISGCANIEFIRMIDSNNAMQDKLVVELDKSKLEECGYDIGETLGKIEADFIDIKNYVDVWKKSFGNNPEIANVYDKIQQGIKVEVVPPVRNKVSISITFADLSMFGLFYGYSTIDNYEYEKAMEDVGPFIDKMISIDYSSENYGILLYKYSMLKDDGILKSLKDFEFNGVNYYSKYNDHLGDNYTIDDINAYQIFTYPDDRIYSNADDKEVLNGVSFLRWSLSDKDEDFQMTIYKVAPRVVSWYIIAILVSFVFVLTFGIILFVKSRKNKKLGVNNE